MKAYQKVCQSSVKKSSSIIRNPIKKDTEARINSTIDTTKGFNTSIVLTFNQHIAQQYPSAAFLKTTNNHNSQLSNLDAPLSEIMAHSFPSIYGLLSKKINEHHKILCNYFRIKMTEAAAQQNQETIKIIYTIYQLLSKISESKQYIDDITKKHSHHPAINEHIEAHLKNYIKKCFKELMQHLNDYAIAANNTHEAFNNAPISSADTINIISGINCRIQHFIKTLDTESVEAA